jgi:hypothetical protein
MEAHPAHFKHCSACRAVVYCSPKHQAADWPAAFLCGIAYNLVAVRTGSLSACVLAHAITNLGLGIYIMSTRQWGFW